MPAWILTVIKFVPTLLGARKLISVIGDLQRFIKESIEAIESIKEFVQHLSGDLQVEGNKCLKEVDDSLEVLADICGKIPMLKKHEQDIRDVIKI